ncbi:nitroreductase family protein [Terrisporobacter sp.]|uniref:nitroreductase family protein n=2 Tax=Terrisporobacter sp. TaxID=1965305 RepID=UPI002A83ADA6|nr:nitroreductase family protein [Terrisporobacter sp.]MDY4737741.1 nitroreductase family protein [Terrisporobacter sp.]
MILDLVKKSRSYRIFDESYKLKKEDLIDLIELARFSPCGKNGQYLRFIPIYQEEILKKIYPYLAWAAYLKDWNGPTEGERPTGIILVVSNEGSLNDAILSCDMGIVSQSIMLGATEKNLGGCMIRALNRKKIAEVLSLPENYVIHIALAIGKPAQNVIVEDINEGDDIKYWMDKDKTHHVPKIILDDLIID